MVNVGLPLSYRIYMAFTCCQKETDSGLPIALSRICHNQSVCCIAWQGPNPGEEDKRGGWGRKRRGGKAVMQIEI